ncbi:mutl: DNA mismatch repair protein MutL [Rubrobacter radiotolerans]|uniref:DNA mismatch repair protein MutL n=1 Tax=Rubrobacter radiotolerans TaxID=42256 RepID=A0A023WZS8_RUBRA|nr:DNA mismatch repair endonuclease MutL [Rubrobacter radiotolerans]AHY45319.1 mutl: DNA mismatch repair protein MutL [Rubrobacter radiotolerans]MDX5892731.1 DNA mismatch repair endonuclease MutL [Rubrobacter radiotolerans]SMC02373.1 DNA mismatch repair protein MutL [Rubrobacter radiotolerans DSM 5868]
MESTEPQGTKVRVLDPVIAQQVAAGEVVDRPASVVKELVENSLDAGASRIEVELADGGTTRIVVRDDGRGMSAGDAKLSVLRHATSKIHSVEDLEAVTTLGFRGEALPSIASVSAFELTTSTGEGPGTKVTVDGGAPAAVAAIGCPKGTTVTVDRLFYNVPARRAFLKGSRPERAAITDTLTHLAVTNPTVGFRLVEGGREYLSLPQARDLRERLAAMHGVGKVRAFRSVEYESGAFRVTGFAALPSLTEGSRARQTVSVNGRWVRGDTLMRGLDDAYRQTVPAGRYPPVAVNVEVDPRRVDVNVHPTKQTVRFSDDRAARAAVAAAIRQAIEWRPATPPSPPRSVESPAVQGRLPAASEGYGRGFRVAEARPDYEWQGPPRRLDGFREMARHIPEREVAQRAPEPRASGEAAREPHGTFGAEEELPERGALPDLRSLRVIGQLGAGYILVEEPEALWVVDQHVAHERVLLDRLNEGEDAAHMQDLLVPEVVELSPAEAQAVRDGLEELAVYGFEAEPFGPTSVRITSVVSTLAGRDVVGAFDSALAAVAGTSPGREREERILATIACHSAVKMGDRLSQEEMERLVHDWLTTRLPATCPHGRSICFRTSLKEIGRKLDRH